MAAFAVVLAHPAGFAIEAAHGLRIERQDDARFRVGDATSGEFFDDIREAVGYFLDVLDGLHVES